MQLYEQYAVTTAFVCPLYLLTIVLGSLGNGVVIYSYVSDKATHRTFNFLITNLAIADLVICALFTPLLLSYRVHETAGIIGYTPLCELSLLLSMFSTSLMYLVFPLLAYHRKDVTLRAENPRLSLVQARPVMRVFWVLSILSGVMMVLMARREFANSDPLYPHMYRCLLINQSLDLYAQVFLGYSITLYGISVVTTLVIYIQICRSCSSAGVNMSPDEWQATKMCFWVAVVYTICWTPFVLVQFLGVFGTYTELHFNLHGLSSAVGVLGSAASPLLNAVMIPYYKARMKRLIFRQEKEQ